MSAEPFLHPGGCVSAPSPAVTPVLENALERIVSARNSFHASTSHVRPPRQVSQPCSQPNTCDARDPPRSGHAAHTAPDTCDVNTRGPEADSSGMSRSEALGSELSVFAWQSRVVQPFPKATKKTFSSLQVSACVLLFVGSVHTSLPLNVHLVNGV